METGRHDTAEWLRRDGGTLTDLLRGAGYQADLVTIRAGGPDLSGAQTGAGQGNGQPSPQPQPQGSGQGAPGPAEPATGPAGPTADGFHRWRRERRIPSRHARTPAGAAPGIHPNAGTGT